MTHLNKVAGAVLTLVVSIMVASYFLALVLGPAMVFLTSAAMNFRNRIVQLPILLFLVFGFYTPFSLSQGHVFLVLWSVFALCFVGGWLLRERFNKVVSDIFNQPFGRLFHNWLFAMPIIASTLLAVVDLIIYVQDLFGVPTGSLPTPRSDAGRFNLYLSLSYASIIEEVAFRFTPIGTFLLARLFVVQSWTTASKVSFKQRFKLFLTAFLYPDKAKRIAGTTNVMENGLSRGISKPEWIMLITTSIIFGVAHLVSGIGWEAGKITSTFVQGLMFGLVYLAYGSHAPILLHWFFDYYFYSYELGARYVSTALDVLILETFTFLVGLGFLTAFTIMTLKKSLLSKRRANSALSSRGQQSS